MFFSANMFVLSLAGFLINSELLCNTTDRLETPKLIKKGINEWALQRRAVTKPWGAVGWMNLAQVVGQVQTWS